MSLRIQDAELFGVSESSATLAFRVEDAQATVAAPARVLLDGELRATSEGPAATRLLRLEGLAPGTRYALRIETEGGAAAEPDRYLPASFETLPRARANCTASFATLNDLHFGEPRFGGVLLEDGDYGPEAPGFPAVTAEETEVPYWRFMNEDAVAEINALAPDLVVVKGDIADRGLPDQFEAARRTFAQLAMPHHAFLGNHDHYGLHAGLEVDGCALLGQPRAPRTLDLGGWRLILLDTVLPGEHHGVLPDERLGWLARALDATRESAMPTLLFMHHQPVPHAHRHEYPNTIGLLPDDSVRLFELLARHPQVRGVLIGHTHRNRVRHYAETGALPFVEVNCTKDYPGGFAHYRLYEDGSFRQEVHRTGSARALAHSTRCAECFRGFYRRFALGPLEARSFATGGFPG